MMIAGTERRHQGYSLQDGKQWGKSTSTGEYVTHTFPIKFTVIPIVVAGALTSNTSGNTGSQSNPCYRSITVSNFVFCMYDNARGYAGSTYIAIGYQLQWGYSTSTGVTFPIAFRECYAVVSNAHSNTTGNTDHYHLLSWSATGASFGYWNMSFYGTLYIALGVE